MIWVLSGTWWLVQDVPCVGDCTPQAAAATLILRFQQGTMQNSYHGVQ
jgi:hypothetical protein